MKQHFTIRKLQSPPHGTWCRVVLWLSCLALFSPHLAQAQNDHCDPTRVMTAEACAKCHINEVKTWKGTPHFRTFAELGRRPEAKAICSKMGLRSVKRLSLIHI